MRLVTVLICDLPVASEREKRLKSFLMNNVMTPWVASVLYREASTIQDRFHPKLALLDLDPSPEDGLAVIPLIKGLVPYIFVTGSHVSEHFVLQALNFGATEFLPGENIQAALAQAAGEIQTSRSKANNPG